MFDPQFLNTPTGPMPALEVAPVDPEAIEAESLMREWHPFPMQPLPEDWTLEKVRSARKQHDLGKFSESVRLRDVLTIDARVESALSQRCATPTGLPIHVCPAVDAGSPGAALSRRVAQEVGEWFSRKSRVAPHHVRRRILEDLVMIGVSIAQIFWKPSADGSQWEIDRIEPWPMEYSFWHPTLRAYVIVTTAGLLTPRHGDGKWLVIERYGLKSWLHGALRGLSTPWADRAFGVRYRAQAAARQGSPPPVGKLPDGTPIDSDYGKAFQKFVRAIWNGRPWGVIPNGAEVGLLELKTMAWQIFNDIVKCSDADIAIALLGQDGTQAKGGVYSSPQFKGIRFDYVEDDARVLDAAWSTGLSMPYAVVNYGIEYAPTVESAIPDPEEADQKAAIARQVEAFSRGIVALRGAGFELAPDYVNGMAERYGVTPPKLTKPLEPLPAPQPMPDTNAAKSEAAAQQRIEKPTPPEAEEAKAEAKGEDE